KFTYMSILWLHQPSETFQLSWDEEYNPPDHFHSEDGWLQAQFRDVILCSDSMHQQRSNASSRVRPEAGAAIFRCTDMEFANRADMFRELIGWISGDDTSGSYKVLAPILFRDYEGQMDKWKIFRNPILIRTYAALMLGPSSVKKAKGSDLYVRDTSHCNLELIWGVRSVTPASIAASAILARFSASADNSFQPVGSVTGIAYQQDFEFYLKYLCEGLRTKKPSVISLFEEWN
ncbi:hypothetical protein M422DRAFT_88393, partial [Sphaerobolus stellatus SS14]